MRARIAMTIAAGVVVAAIGGGTALGKSAPPTKIRFKLDDHSVASGESVTGTVVVMTGKGKDREPFAGATLTVLVDKVEVATLTTDADGRATVEHAGAEDGEHVMKVVFAGDAGHKKAKRAQGFEVGHAADDGSDQESQA